MEGNQFDSLRMPDKGDPLSDNVHSASWIRALVQAAIGRSMTGGSTGLQEPSLSLLTPKVDGSKIAVPAFNVVGAFGATYPTSPTEEPRAYMQGCVSRSQLLYYTKEDNPTSVDYIQAYPFLPGKPVRVRCKTATTRPYFTGMPVGRAVGETSISPDEGGLILVSKPYEVSSGVWYAYVLPDTAQDWDAFIVRPSAGDGTVATAFLTGRGSFTFGLLTADTSNTASNNLNDIVTNYRGTCHPRDADEDYEDGHYVRVQYKWGEWKVVWASCAGITGLTGKALVP